MKKHRIFKWAWVVIFVFVGGILSEAGAGLVAPTRHFTPLSIPVLGVTLNPSHQPIGVVTYVLIHFKKRADNEGLKIRFQEVPGRFSSISRKAVASAIARASKAANLETDSWSVVLTYPHPGLTLYGESLSAMVGLSVVALAKGESIIYGRSITGTITQDGHIGKVGGVPWKVYAAYSQHLDRVLIPEEQDATDGDWRVPFLMHVSHVGTVEQAYQGLTGHSLFSAGAAP